MIYQDANPTAATGLQLPPDDILLAYARALTIFQHIERELAVKGGFNPDTPSNLSEILSTLKPHLKPKLRHAIYRAKDERNLLVHRLFVGGDQDTRQLLSDLLQTEARFESIYERVCRIEPISQTA